MQFGVSESIAHWGKYKPELPAIHYNGKTASYRELNSRINAVCNEINRLNFSDSRVAISVGLDFHFLVSLIATLRVGKSAVLLNIGLPDDALRTNIKDTDVSSIIYDDSNKRIAKLMATSDDKMLCIDDILGSAQISEGAYRPGIFRQPSDEWGVVFSSGTTGIPKGIVRDHNSIVTELLGWCLELGLNRKTSFYIGRPIYYTGGLVLLLSTLLVGGLVFLNDYKDDNDPNEIWHDYQRTLATTAIDWAFFIPDQVRFFIRIVKETQTTPYAAKNILVMGAPISGNEKVSATQVLKSVLIESWGNSESLGTITDEEDLIEKPNSIGRPFLTDEMYVINEECVPLESFKLGRIAGSEEAGFFVYCNRPEETKQVKQNALIISDDIGYIDEDGYFYVCGRDQDCIIIDDKPIFISKIEDKIRQVVGIKESCVIAKSTTETSAELIAIVVQPSSTVDEVALLHSLNLVLSTNEQLVRVLFVDKIPRLPSGKIDRISVKKMVDKT